MPNAWFRMYAEFADDPKVQMMSEAMQRRLLMLFCLRCLGKPVETFRETEIAFKWRISMQDLTETKALFLQNEFIDEKWNILNWDKRQYISDSSTERVRQYRERKKQDETLPEHNETEFVTAPEQIQSRTDSKTEQIQKQKEPVARDDRKHRPTLIVASGVFELPLANKTEYQVPEPLFREYTRSYPGVSVMVEFAKMRTWLISNPKKGKTRAGMPRFMNSWLDRAQNDVSKNSGGKNANLSKQGMGALVGVSAESIARGEYQGGAYAYGGVQASEDEPRGLEISFGDVHEPPEEPGPQSVPSGDGDFSRKPTRTRGDDAPLTW